MKIVKKFIETKIINHKFNNRRRYDAGYNFIIKVFNNLKNLFQNNKVK